MPGTPFLYYGDEIMMKTMPLDSKDGGYQRTGSRIPMVWNNDDSKHGFSKTNGETYLPFYTENKTSVKDAKLDPNSLLSFIKKMIQIRKSNQDLLDDNFEISYDKQVIIIKRGKLKIYLNCSNEAYHISGTVIISTKDIKNSAIPPFSAAITQ